MQCKKSFFARDNLECLDFKITRQGVTPLPDKVQAIKDIAVPTNKKQLTSNMWTPRSDILDPLTKMTSKQAT